MGLLDQLKKNLPGLKKKAEDLVEEHDEQIKDGLDKAAKFANEKTGGKHRDKIAKGVDKAKDAIDDMADQDGEPGAGPRKPKRPRQ
jgi:MT0933-like antitoxin protein